MPLPELNIIPYLIWAAFALGTVSHFFTTYPKGPSLKSILGWSAGWGVLIWFVIATIKGWLIWN